MQRVMQRNSIIPNLLHSIGNGGILSLMCSHILHRAFFVETGSLTKNERIFRSPLKAKCICKLYILYAFEVLFVQNSWFPSLHHALRIGKFFVIFRAILRTFWPKNIKRQQLPVKANTNSLVVKRHDLHMNCNFQKCYSRFQLFAC